MAFDLREQQKMIRRACEALRITKEGKYELDGRTVNLPELSQPPSTAICLEEPMLDDLAAKVDSGNIEPKADTEYLLMGADSFDAARGIASGKVPLVLNFANAVSPGGGFLVGARAQEESLCRASTLYASLTSRAAAQYYLHNKDLESPVGSNCMILSPAVTVFRAGDGRLLETPFQAAVLTSPAPNLRHAGVRLSSKDLKSILIRRIELMVKAAIALGYGTFVLGAWGCGAFGHDPWNVAACFRHVLIEEGYGRYFDCIVFAILDDPAKKNWEAFENVFADVCAPVNLHQAHPRDCASLSSINAKDKVQRPGGERK